MLKWLLKSCTMAWCFGLMSGFDDVTPSTAVAVGRSTPSVKSVETTSYVLTIILKVKI